MATEKRIAKYIIIIIGALILYFLFFGMVDNGLKNQQLTGHELPIGWHTVESSVGLCIGYIPQYSGFPFETERNIDSMGCGRQTNPLASLTNFLVVFAVAFGLVFGFIQLVTLALRRAQHE